MYKSNHATSFYIQSSVSFNTKRNNKTKYK